MCEQNMNIIREITGKLTTPPNYNPALFVGDDFIDLEVPKGKATSYGIYNTSEVAVARTVIKKGTEFNAHTHPETEYAIMISGKLELIYGRPADRSEVLIKAGFAVIKANTIHSAIAIEDCELIVLTIPASKGFPDVRK